MTPVPAPTHTRQSGLARGLRETAGVLFLALLAAILSLVLLEGAVRLLPWHYPALRAADPFWVYDATKGWFPMPHATSQTFLGGPDSGLIRSNGLGLRGSEVPLVRKPGRRRLLVVGDSFAFGIGVDEPHAFSSRLSDLLDGSRPGVWEVVNLAVPGYSTDQELLLYQELGRRLSPDVVVLVMCDNDFDGNGEDFVYGRYYKPFAEVAGGRLQWRNIPVPRLGALQEARLRLGQRSHLWNLVRSRHASQPWLDRVIRSLDVGHPRRSSMDPIEITARLVAEVRRVVEASGARLLVVNTGHRGERTERFHRLRSQLASDGIQYFGLEDLLGRARQNQPGRLWDFSDTSGDTHWNVDAHEYAAAIIFTHLRRLGWIS